MSEKAPLVSISSITYNHAPYIRQCIEGFLMQKTTFLFEILIHDDASTDGTAEIIEEYEKKYPNLIRPIYQHENQYSKGIIISPTFNWPRALGKYIAFCEGDDYWTDSDKLQKQVDFLEANPEYGMVHTGVQVVDSKNNLLYISKSIKPSGEVFYDLLLKSAFIVTSSVCVRSNLVHEVIDHAKKKNLNCIFDYWLWLHIAMRVKVYYNPSVMSAYRSHSGGITQSNRKYFYKTSPLAVLDAISYKLKHFPEKIFIRKWHMYIAYWKALTSSSINLKERFNYFMVVFRQPVSLFAFFPALLKKFKNKFSK